jgi:hypothetical protein
MSKTLENIPNSSVLINSMRSIGYDFESALADILDNSITAKANRIDINFPVGNDDDIFLEIVDNGIGMNREELIEAMRFGSVKGIERDKDDLGRFGLGLKTASLSQCRKFTVVSKKNDFLFAFSWDIDLLSAESNWNMMELSMDEIVMKIPKYQQYSYLDSYTIVLWEKFDRLRQEVDLFNNIKDIFSKKIRSAEKHLALIFHRFIENGLKILINDFEIKSIDPFLSLHNKTDEKPEEFLNTMTSTGENEKVGIKTYILPYHKDLSKADFEKIGGLENLDKQGFYVYRNKRLMIYGTWFKIRPKSELARNARIRVDIPNTLDDLWSIDIKKQKAIIPSTILDQLRGEVSISIEKSKKIYEYKGNIQTKDGSIWTKVIDLRENSIRYEINLKSDLLENLFDNLDDKTINTIKKIFNLVEYSLPYKDIYNAVSEKRDVNKIEEFQADTILTQAITLFNDFRNRRNLSSDAIIDKICDYEPFLSANIKERLKEIVKTSG